MSKVAAVVVFYNPGELNYPHLQLLAAECDHLLLLDNSRTPISKPLGLPEGTTHYRHFPQNVGLATALNHAVKIAQSLNCTYLFTLDQDSTSYPGSIRKLMTIMMDNPDAAIASVNHIPEEEYQMTNIEVSEQEFVMTSGNLVRLSALKNAGAFPDNFFIDMIDHELCLRLRSKGFKILRANNLFISHIPGERTIKHFAGRTFYPSYHSPVRLYFRTRNRFQVNKMYGKLYPEYVKGDRKRFVREILEVILFEPKKFAKLGMILQGYIHFRQQRFGPLG